MVSGASAAGAMDGVVFSAGPGTASCGDVESGRFVSGVVPGARLVGRFRCVYEFRVDVCGCEEMRRRGGGGGLDSRGGGCLRSFGGVGGGMHHSNRAYGEL